MSCLLTDYVEFVEQLVSIKHSGKHFWLKKCCGDGKNYFAISHAKEGNNVTCFVNPSNAAGSSLVNLYTYP